MNALILSNFLKASYKLYKFHLKIRLFNKKDIAPSFDFYHIIMSSNLLNQVLINKCYTVPNKKFPIFFCAGSCGFTELPTVLLLSRDFP